MAEYGEDMADHVLSRTQFAHVNSTFLHYVYIYHCSILCVVLCIFVLFYVLFVLCRSVYCLCLYVYCTAATGWLPNCS